MSTRALLISVVVLCVLTLAAGADADSDAVDDTARLRPPAVPLVTHNPYFSVWSRADKLTDDWSRHWTGAVQPVCGMVRVDGKAYRWAGALPQQVEAARQVSVSVTATATTYEFDAGGVTLRAEFVSPVLAADPDLASRPVTYLTMSARSGDGRERAVEVYVDCTGEWAVHEALQRVEWSRARLEGLELLRIGTEAQPVLERAGDHTRIDWGMFNLAVRSGGERPPVTALGGHETCRLAFAGGGCAGMPKSDDLRMPRPVNDDWPVLAAGADLGKVGAAEKSETVLLAYDDREVVEYFGRRLRPYWARGGMGFGEMVLEMSRKRGEIVDRCRAFDRSLRERTVKVGGEKYAQLCELTYRQVMAAHVIAADFDGTMLMFSKENSSNGCIGTVDVMFPTSPFFLAENTELLKANIRPVMDYASSPRWKFAFAPHDLGTYPRANGQVYGGGERTEENQMPVEECGNMFIMLAAVAKHDGNTEFAAGPAGRWWPAIEKWAEYLREHGLDPEHQLCTDDFTGHLARNANLAVKAVVGLGAYSELCKMRGESRTAAEYRRVAEEYAGRWRGLAKGERADGAGVGVAPTVLAYGQAGTWSLKYNLVWDRVLGLGLFPDELKRSEVAFYRTKTGKYGTPMDNRAEFTKPEWVVWSACLTGDRADFDAMVEPVWTFANQTRDRVPLSDWFTTNDARNRGMFARGVVGGMWMGRVVFERE